MIRLLVLVAFAVLLAPGQARPVGLTLIVTGVEPRSNSAAISWQASGPLRTVVEYGTTADLGIWTKRTGPATTGRILLPALEPGTIYRYRVVGVGQTRVEETGSFETDGPRPWAVATTTRNALFVDWQPLFPRMVFHTCSWYYGSALAAGINLFMGNACQGPHEQIELLGARGYSALSVPDRKVNGRGLIGFYQQDEPDGFGLTDLPKLPSSKESKRVTFLTLTDHFSSRSAPLPVGKGVYPRLISRAEMIGFDTYPLQTRCTKDFTLVYDMQRELVALAAGKPTFQWIEAGPMGKCSGLDPTAATIRAQVWLAVAGGARGIGYFPDFWPGAIGTTIGAVNRTLAALAPALLAPEVPVRFGPHGTPVKAGARKLNGAFYVIAANPSFSAAKAIFTVPGLKAGSVRIYGENRTIPVRNGRFSDTFGGLASRIYIAAPPLS